MVEIQKLKEGRKISQQQYNQAKAEYQQAYAASSPEMQRELDKLMQSSQNYSVADPMNNRSSREFATQMYRNATAIATGTYQQTSTPVAPTKNAFNGYSKQENEDNANALTNKFLSTGSSGYGFPAQSSTGSGNVSGNGSTTSGSGKYYQVKWNRYLTSTWGLDNESFKDRFDRFVDGIGRELSAAAEAQANGMTIRGMAPQDVEQIGSMLTYLQDLKNNSGTREAKDSISRLLKFAGPLHMDEATFKSYFGDFLPQATEADKNKQTRINEGYKDYDISQQSQYIQNLARNNHFNFMTKDGQVYAFDQNYNLVQNPFAEINDDYTTEGQQGSSYGHGLFIDANGNVFMGDTSQIGEGHQFKQALDEFVTKMNRSGLWKSKNWIQDESFSDDELTNQLAESIRTQQPQLSRYSFTDVGALFAGSKNVLAFDITGKELTPDRFGNIKFDSNTKFAYMGEDGRVKIGNLAEVQQNVGAYKRSGYSGETNSGTGDVSDLRHIFEGAETLDRELTQERYGWQDFLNDAINPFTKGFWFGHGTDGAIFRGIRYALSDTSIGSDPQKFVNNTLQALENPNKKLDGAKFGNFNGEIKGSEFLSMLDYYNGNQDKVLALIGQMVTEGEVKLTPEQRKIFNKYVKQRYASSLYRQSSSPVSSEKDGGILKAEYGDVIDIRTGKVSNPDKPTIGWHERMDKSKSLANTEKRAEKAYAEGYDSLEQYDAAKSKPSWSKSDSLRVAALAQDVAGLVAAISGAATGGAGSIAAEVSGFTSMATDLAADILDPSVSRSDVVKNAVINTALGAGAFVGAKAPKIIKSAMKIVPHVMMVAGAAGIAFDEDVHKTVQKLTSGKEKLNTEDWKNIYMILKMGTGLGTGAAMGVSNRRAQKKISEKTTIKTVDSKLDPTKTYLENPSGGDPIALPKKEAGEVKKLINDGKIDEAKTKLKELKGEDGTSQLLSDDQIDSLTDTSREWKKFFKKKNNLDNEVEAKEVTTTDPEKLQDLLAAEEARVYGTNGNQSSWQNRMARWDKAALTLLHPIQGAKGKINAPRTAVELAAMRNAGINSLSARGAKELELKLRKQINDLPYAFDENTFATTFDESNISNQAKAARKAAGQAEAASATRKDHTGNDVDIRTASRQRKEAAKKIKTLTGNKQANREAVSALELDQKRSSLEADKKWLTDAEGYNKEHANLTQREIEAEKKITFDESKDKAAFDTKKTEYEAEANALRSAGPAADSPEAKKLAVLEERLKDKNLLSSAERQVYESEVKSIQDEYVKLDKRRQELIDDVGSGKSVAERELELQRLTDEKTRLDNELQQIESDIAEAQQKETANKKAYDKLRDQVRKKGSQAEAQKESDLVDAAQNSSASRKVKKGVTVKASDNSEVKIEKGKDVVSLVGRDKAKAEAYAKRVAGPNAKQIDKSELAKIMKNSEKINGAYVSANGTVYVYEQGGQTKYSHLRK